jgi:hypothetical protein
MGWLASLLPLVGNLIGDAVSSSSSPATPTQRQKRPREFMPIGRSQIPVNALQDPGMDPQSAALREALARGYL